MKRRNDHALVVLLVLLVCGCGQCTSDTDGDHNSTADLGAQDAGADTDTADAPPDTAVDDTEVTSCTQTGCDSDPAGAYCDTTTGSCVQCLEAEHCPDEAAPICRSGACAACQTDTQCQTAGLGESCRDDGRCVTCERDDDCPVTAPFCDSAGECVRCVGSDDCPSTAPACVAGDCASCTTVDTCTNDDLAREVAAILCERATIIEGAYVGSGFEDQFDAVQGVTCADDPGLSADIGALITAVEQGRIVIDPDGFESCRTQGDCGALFVPHVADGGSCYTSAECLSGECDDGAMCPGTCAILANTGEACAFNGECRRDLVCIAGQCQDTPLLGEACENICADGLFCDSNVCVPRSGVGESCAPASFCRTDLYCDPSTDLCAERPGPGELCISGLFCRDGVRCFKGTCHDPQPVGSTCEATAQCAPGLRCVDAQCIQILLPGEECSESSHCALGLGCIDGRCRALPDIGEPCFEEGGCLRGLCDAVSGTCEPLALGASCSGTYPLDVFDPCGDTATCGPDGTGNAICHLDGDVGDSCDAVADPPCHTPDTRCNNSGVCEAVCAAEAQ